MTNYSFQMLHSDNGDRVIFRGVVGSRAYGTNRAGSDEDIRGVFLVPPVEYALLAAPPPQVADERNDRVYYSMTSGCGATTTTRRLWSSLRVSMPRFSPRMPPSPRQRVRCHPEQERLLVANMEYDPENTVLEFDVGDFFASIWIDCYYGDDEYDDEPPNDDLLNYPSEVQRNALKCGWNIDSKEGLGGAS